MKLTLPRFTLAGAAWRSTGLLRPVFCLCLVVWLGGGCRPAAPTGFQGYVEGEMVYVGGPLGGTLGSGWISTMSST